MEGAWLLLTEPMFEFSRSVRKQVEFDGRKLVSVEGGGCSKRSNFSWSQSGEVNQFLTRLVSSCPWAQIGRGFHSYLSNMVHSLWANCRIHKMQIETPKKNSPFAQASRLRFARLCSRDCCFECHLLGKLKPQPCRVCH